MNSIRYKSMLSLSLVSLTIMLATFVTSYILAENYFKNSLSQQIKESDQALSIVLKEPIFAYDVVSSKDILDSFVAFPYIHRISVQDHRGQLIVNVQEDANTPNDDDILNHMIDIKWNNEKLIGRVSVDYRLDSNEALLSNVQHMFIVIGVSLLLAQILTNWIVVSKYVVSPLQRVVRALTEVAEGEGDLTQRLNVKSSDEVGTLARQFDTFVESLHNIVKQIITSSNSLTLCSQDIKRHSLNNSENTSTQLSELEQIATALSEMSSSTNEVYQTAESTSVKTNSCNQLAAQSRHVVKETVSTINDLAGDLSQTASKVNQLKERTVHISTVLDVIRGIADQTNLLALNAAIEAARAGEQGRGFAVVADEVRSLAQRTQDSTLEIEQIIQELQNASVESCDLMEVANHTLNDAIDSTGSAMESLESIIVEVAEINDMNVHVAGATKEQNIVAAEISEKVTNITMLASEITSNAGHVTQLGNNLDSTAKSIKQHLDKFQV